jgi:hypothetical protein
MLLLCFCSVHEQVLNQVIEQELVLKNLLGKFLPLLSYMVANEQQKYSHVLLRETSILTMCRYMSTSSVVCESLLPLLFTVLEKEKAVSVRTTVMIALGDLAFRFPNTIEPWTQHLYSRYVLFIHLLSLVLLSFSLHVCAPLHCTVLLCLCLCSCCFSSLRLWPCV